MSKACPTLNTGQVHDELGDLPYELGRSRGSTRALMRSSKSGIAVDRLRQTAEDHCRLSWWFSWVLLFAHVGQAAVAMGVLMWVMIRFVWNMAWRATTEDVCEDEDGEGVDESDEDEKILFIAVEEMIPLNRVEPQPRRSAQGLLVDTGAGVTIANGSESFLQYELETSPGSKAGQQYAGPGEKGVIKNRGQRLAKLRLGSSTGWLTAIKFQDAAVRRPILSVGESTEADNVYIFDRLGSAIPLKGGPEVEEIRRLVIKLMSRLTWSRIGIPSRSRRSWSRWTLIRRAFSGGRDAARSTFCRIQRCKELR